MADEKKKNVIELVIFFGVAYGVNFLISILSVVSDSFSAEVYGLFIMLLPACGAYFARKYRKEVQKEDRKINRILLLGIFLELFLIVFMTLDVLSVKSAEEMGGDVAVIISIVVLGYMFFKKEGAGLFENGEKVHKDFAIFFVLLFIRNGVSIIPAVISGHTENLGNLVTGVMSILNVFLSIIIFYGEEYGWRAYLQGKAQKRFGKKAGSMIVGVLWCFWHIPLWLMEGETIKFAELLFAGLVLIGMAVFLGYIYMRTQNVWLCAIAHGLYNAMGAGMGETYDRSGEMVYYVVQLVFAFIMMFYLLKKEYKTTKEEK